MDPRNEDYYAETPSERERRQLAEQKQAMKEAIKEAFEEAGISKATSLPKHHNLNPGFNPIYEELLKRIGF